MSPPYSELLVEEIASKFAYFKELDVVWQGIPGFDSVLISSDPSIDHSQNLLSLTWSDNTSCNQVEQENINDKVLDDLDEHDGLDKVEDDKEDDDVDMQVDESSWKILGDFDVDNDPMVADDMVALPSVVETSNQVIIKYVSCYNDYKKLF